MSEPPIRDLLARFKQAQPLIAERERLVTEVLDLMREAADGSPPARLASRLTLLRTQVASLNEQIRALLPYEDDEPTN
jgi:hypothetical protein